MHCACELAVVIGETARNVKRDAAMEYIAGYTVANDYTVRDYLENYYRPNLRAKSRDSATPLGPWLVDRDDVPDPAESQRATNDRKWEAHTRRLDARHDFLTPAVLIESLSSFMTLSPGDLILTGTPEGLADCHPGDVVVTEIEGVGRLQNTIIANLAAQGLVTS